MIEGWLIYNKEDLKKNKVFATLLQEHGKKNGLAIKILERENISLGTSKNGLFIKIHDECTLPAFAINRTRDALLTKQLELLNVHVFNSFQVTHLCNDKIKTHQYVNALGVPSVKTLFYDCRYDTSDKIDLTYPLVVKSIDGHGGQEVYKVEKKEELHSSIEQLGSRYLVVQELCSRVGVDIRVFVVGNEILAAIKRESKVDFRSNYSLGGETSIYPIDDNLASLVHKILRNLACDCVGIDFMIAKDGSYLFNEIEDVVGSRSLYQHSDIDIAECYIRHIKQKLG